MESGSLECKACLQSLYEVEEEEKEGEDEEEEDRVRGRKIQPVPGSTSMETQRGYVF